LQGIETALIPELQQVNEEIESVNQIVATLDQRSAEYVNAKAQADEVQSLALGLRREAQDILQNLRAASISLVSTRGKIREITVELHECGYAGSRREIAEKLKETLTIIQDVGSRRNLELEQAGMKKAFGLLVQIHADTPNIMRLIEESSVEN
jgi:cell division septum initiation protein DivIVA